jgi:exosortase
VDQGGGSRPRIGAGALRALCLLLAAAAYRPLIRWPSGPLALAFENWLFEPSYDEPLPVLLGAAWLLWCRRGYLWALPRAQGVGSQTALAAALFAGAAGVHAWATLTSTPFLLLPSLMLALFGSAALRAGRAGCGAIALPVAFLAFAIPVPAPLLNYIVWEQQEAIGRLTADLLSFAGAPATAAGILFETPGRLFLVIQTCSGIRMAEVFAALAILLRGSEPPQGWRTLTAGGLGLLLGLVVNELRVLWIALGEGPLAVGDAHGVQGVAALLVGIPALLALHRVVRKGRTDAVRRVARPPAEAGTAPWPSLAGLFLLLAGISLFLVPETLPRAAAYDLTRIPAASEGWESELLATDFQLLGSVRFDEVMRRGYRAEDGHSVELFVGTSLRGDPGTSPFSRSTELPQAGWIVLERFPTTLQGRPVEGLILAGEGAARAMAYTWRVGDRGLLRETLRAGLALDRNPFAQPRRRAVVRIATDLEEPGQMERLRAEALLEDFAEVFGNTLPEA